MYRIYSVRKPLMDRKMTKDEIEYTVTNYKYMEDTGECVPVEMTMGWKPLLKLAQDPNNFFVNANLRNKSGSELVVRRMPNQTSSVRNIGDQVRKFIETKYKSVEGHDLEACIYVKSICEHMGVQGVVITSSYVEFNEKVLKQPHYWILATPGYFLDMTADQYNKYMKTKKFGKVVFNPGTHHSGLKLAK